MAMTVNDIDRVTAKGIVEKLRDGVPPRRYSSLYTAGMESFIRNVRRRHFDDDGGPGKIRFVSGSWGSGKTHLFRLLAEQAFDAGYLVSTVEISRHEAPFNKFELVLANIIRNISSADTDVAQHVSSPLGTMLHEALLRESTEAGVELPEAIEAMKHRLFAEQQIDIDVRRVIAAYWDTYMSSETDSAVLDERRGLLIQWFSGEVNKNQMRKEYDVQKGLSKENARLFLASLVNLTKFLGYRGLVVLFDESEMTSSTLRRSDLRQAHNNLLHLINEIGEVSGLMLIYAAVPGFFDDPRTGIAAYGALAARIGRPEERPPAALDKIWNLDAVEPSADDFRTAACKIRAIYLTAYPGDAATLMSEAELCTRVDTVVDNHGRFEQVSKWRAVVKECIKVLDRSLDGAPQLSPIDSYRETKKTMLDELGDD
jgi:hypothetical protein